MSEGFVDKILGHYEDTGCKYSKRCQDCPFKDCIDSLPYKKQQLLLRADTIMDVWTEYDNGLNYWDLKRKFKIPAMTIRRWVVDKDSILNSLNQYVIL